ncbi:MAG: polyribonucleotide nucleotidyltransferase, partial [Planctomycetes bacterium]|nr:polyribonucleotide nucleotidyltransferase [Planctomycetota bacterium]
MKPIRVELELGGRTLRWETGYLAKQAAGSTLCTINETTAFAAVCTADPRPGIDFFPLSVDYREKTQAAGKFPGGFIKREGRPTNKEILTCRLIDRPVRPMFPKSYNDEVQICAFVVQVDRVNDPDIAAMNASFAALHTADLPFIGPLGAVRVGRVDGRLVMNPDFEQRKVSDLEVIVAGSRDAITMVEGTCAEISEDDFLDVLDFAHDGVRKICGAMDELRRKCGKSFSEWEEPEVSVHPVIADVRGAYRSRLVDALLTDGKFERSAAVKALRAEAMEEFAGDDDDDAEERAMAIKKSWHDFEADVTREMLVKGKRVDGRRTDEVRDIHISAGWQSRLHGSAVFTRGETQALVVCTLGTLKDQQIVDGLDEEYSKKFDFQYNFPPYCVGEVKMMRGTSRREIGHGNLAERSLLPVLPDPMDFPYTIRLISDIMESNGSSSMASVCGGTLAMMDAGVPIKQPVAGIAMGLLRDEKSGKVVVLSDILGSEDHHGDMDFKVSGTGRGITAVQMDIKIKG